MHSIFTSTHQKLKAVVLLLSLCLMMMGTCPIQKFLLNTFFIQVETSKLPSAPASLVKTSVICASTTEALSVPLVEQSKQASSSNLLFFLLANTFPYLFHLFREKAFDPGFKKEDPTAGTIPLFLRNQVFRI